MCVCVLCFFFFFFFFFCFYLFFSILSYLPDTSLILCLDGFEPGPIQLGLVQVSPEQIFLLVYIEIFRSEQMTHAIS